MPEPSAVSRHPDGTPERLGRYRLVRPISTGGMARVFEARRESLAGVAPKVAIKVILPDFAAEASFRELFVNEARVGSMVHHTNLVQIQDFDCEDGVYYLVMEYVEGVTLRRAISLSRRHDLQTSLTVLAELGRQVCDGLHHAHTASGEDGLHLGLVHRDIKPSNLIINPQGVVKVLDFGISKAWAVRERKGAVRGTWGYMAPEQAEGEEVSGAADQFGLAAVLYEAATGQSLFPEKEPGTIRQLLAQDEAARRAARISGPLSPLAGVLVRALQRDPVARYPTCEAMGRSLSALVPDPVTARDELVRFQQAVSALAQPGGAPGERPRSNSTMSPSAASSPQGSSQPSRPSAQSPSAPSSSAPSRQASAPVAPHEPLLGLPIAVGGPGAALSASPPPLAVPQPGGGGGGLGRTLISGLALLLALGIVGFTGWAVVLDGKLPAWAKPNAAEVLPTLDAPVDPEAAARARALAEEPVRERAPAAEVEPQPEAAPEEPPEQAAPAVAPAPTPQPEARRGPPAPEPPTRITPPPEQAPPEEPAAVAPAPATEPAPPAEAPPEQVAPVNTARGRLTISSIPRAQVIIDGRFVRYTPVFQHDVEAGSRVVVLITDDGRRTTFPVQVPGGGEARRVWSFEEGRFIQR